MKDEMYSVIFVQVYAMHPSPPWPNVRSASNKFFTDLVAIHVPPMAEPMREGEFRACYKISMGTWRLFTKFKREQLVILVLY